MIIAKILGNAVGTLVVTFGLAVVSIMLWSAGCILWNVLFKKITGVERKKQPDPAWQLQLIPGFVTQLWYTSYVALLVWDLPGDTSHQWRTSVHITAVGGVLLGVLLFDFMHRKIADLYEKYIISAGVGAAVFAAYTGFLFNPQYATIGRYWGIVLSAILDGDSD